MTDPGKPIICSLTAEEVFEGFDVVLEKLKASGIEVESETFPVKLKGRWSVDHIADRVVFRQWPEETPR